MNNIKHTLFLFIVALLSNACTTKQSDKIDLSGHWQFAMDSADRGNAEQWFAKNLSEFVTLPGSMKENDKGFTPDLKTPWTGTIYDSSFYFNPAYEKYRQKGDVKFPFWLSPNKYYKGAAWYRKDVNIPQDWKGKRVVLYMERPHWQTSVWVNNEYAGYQNSLSTAHEYDITDLLQKGTNYITVCVDNRTDSINVGPDSHSVSDHTQGNWNGIVGDIYLQAGANIYIDDIQIYPNIESKTVKADIVINNKTKQAGDIQISLQAVLLEEGIPPLPKFQKALHISPEVDTLTVEYPMGEDVKLWDEFHPDLYQMTVALNLKDQEKIIKEVTFGMRDVQIKDGHILVNGRAVFLRGTLECNTFPITGYPPTDEESWTKIFQVCKESGMNHIRFHSHCPPEAAFDAADKLGIYLQPEAASWPNHGTSLGDGRLTDQYILDEMQRIIKAYGNHPSFIMWAYCNEPYGNYVPFLDKSLAYWKAKDNRHIYTAACIGRSWSVNPGSEFLVRSVPRGLPYKQLPNSTFNYEDRIKDETRPYVTHEMGQYCVFPDFSEIEKYTGVYKAKNFEMFQDILNEHHMGEQAHDFLMASGKLQALCYKAEIEAQLRTPALDGFQLLGLNDFPGQGSAIIGLLNVFWQEKGYITKEEFSHFCNQTVPLAQFHKFVFDNSESLSCPVSIAHYGPTDLKGIHPYYTIKNSKGDLITAGELNDVLIKTGGNTDVGTITYPLNEIQKATQCKLEVVVGKFSNSWDFWVFPSKHKRIDKDEVYYAESLDSKALNVLKNGGKVFLDASGKVENGKDVIANFTPVFWNTSWFKMRPPHTTGILVQNEHPAFADFPTSYHTDYQWWEILINRQIMCIDNFPTTIKPLVQPIDTWFLGRRLAQLLEVKVGEGKLIISTLNLDSATGPASAQLKQSLIKYMNSEAFNPQVEVEVDVLKELFEKKERTGVNLYTVGTPDELKPQKK